MRLLELHLDRFGCFTDRRLRFRTDASLTVVYGANEAGKSTALAAIADLLYGIEARSPFDFLHRYGDMRLGAAIAGEDGQRLDFRRRKGNQNTLLDADEAPLAEDALAPFLGSVDRALFLDAFGLDRERLRTGAQRLIDGGGRIGESLLAAAPGLSSLIGLKASLAAEADELFPLGRKVSSRPFWQACERHSDARKRVRQETLQAGTVREAEAARDLAAQTVSRLRQEQSQLREELSRLGRLKHALPRLRRIDDLEADLAALGPLPDVAGDFPARCRASIEQHRALVLERQRLDDEVSGAKGKLEALSVDDALLGQADTIDRLTEQLGAVIKATDDLPKRQGELTALRQQLDEHARRLGLADRDALLARRPPDSAVALARSLLNQRRRLSDQRQEYGAALKKIVAELDAMVGRRNALGHVADPKPLRRQLDGLAGLPERMAGRDELARSLAARQSDLDDRLARLVVPVTSSDALARLPVPDLASVEQAIESGDALAQRLSEREAERQRLILQQAGVERRLGTLAAEGEVATSEALNQARGAREAVWRALRPRLLGAPLPDDPAVEIASYEAAVTHADQLADRRQAEADRIADFRKLRSDQRECEDELTANGRALDAIAAEARQAEADWNALWSPSKLKPKPPREMRGWLQSRTDILRLLEDLRADRARLAEVESTLAAMTERLRTLAQGLGIEELGPPDLLKATAIAVDAMETAFQDARLMSQEREGCERRQREIEAALGELDQRETEWRCHWSGAAGAVGLRQEARDEEAEAALNIWQAVPALEASLRELEHRVDRMQEDWNAFEVTAAELCDAVAPDLSGAAPVSASAALRQRLVQTRQAATQRHDCLATVAGLEQKVDECRRQVQRNEGELAELCSAAGAVDRGELGPLAIRIEQHASLSGELAKERRALLEAAEGFGETELRAELAGRDPDSLSARLRELDEEEKLQEVRLSEAISIETLAVRDVADIEARTGAASAAQDEQNALADIAGIIETWTGIAAAERLLAAAIEAYRARHHNPLLDRVSQAFAIATGNAFSGIALDYDDADAQSIVAVRSDGSPLKIAALSEGTADQLFLALRIATIEDHARRATALPFIADDLFVTFDDTRTKAGLTLLAELGRTTQAIVFTHHQHVVEAARHLPGYEVETIELG